MAGGGGKLERSTYDLMVQQHVVQVVESCLIKCIGGRIGRIRELIRHQSTDRRSEVFTRA